MASPDEKQGPVNAHPTDGTREEKYLAAEYQALIDLDTSRNDRLDRFLTMFVTMAAAPWALYALILKEHGMPSFMQMSFVVAAAFVVTGVLGALVAMMYIQVWFTIVLYMRAVNSIREYFLERDTKLSFHLPSKSTVPPYYGKGSYIQFAVGGMALVNSGYVALGIFGMVSWPCSLSMRVGACAVIGAVSWSIHMAYYSRQARKRERHSQGTKELKWK
jgi:hypothetical protein